MEYDDLLVLIGEFGTYQRIIMILVSMVGIQAAFANMTIVFMGGYPDHYCKIPSLSHLNLAEDILKNLSIPTEIKDDEEVYSSCKMYDRNYSSWTMDNVIEALSEGPGNTTKIDCTNGWIYDKSTYQSTIVTEVSFL